jgi:hypothetical protein
VTGEPGSSPAAPAPAPFRVVLEHRGYDLVATLTRAEYDSLLPMSSTRRAAWGAAERRWLRSGARVEVVFASRVHAECFRDDRRRGTDADDLPLRAVDREFRVVVPTGQFVLADLSRPEAWLVLVGLPRASRGAWWRLSVLCRDRGSAESWAQITDERPGVAVVPGDAPGLRLLDADGEVLPGGAR